MSRGRCARGASGDRDRRCRATEAVTARRSCGGCRCRGASSASGATCRPLGRSRRLSVLRSPRACVRWRRRCATVRRPPTTSASPWPSRPRPRSSWAGFPSSPSVLGVALGFDTFGTLLGNPIGIACLALGGALILGAQRWNAALVRRARPAAGVPGLDAELLAIALSGGVSIDRARRSGRRRRPRDRTDAATEAVLGPLAHGGRARPWSCSGRRRRSRDTGRESTGRLRAARLSSPPPPSARRLHAARVPPPRRRPDAAQRHDPVPLPLTF